MHTRLHADRSDQDKLGVVLLLLSPHTFNVLAEVLEGVSITVDLHTNPTEDLRSAESVIDVGLGKDGWRERPGYVLMKSRQYFLHDPPEPQSETTCNSCGAKLPNDGECFDATQGDAAIAA